MKPSKAISREAAKEKPSATRAASLICAGLPRSVRLKKRRKYVYEQLASAYVNKGIDFEPFIPRFKPKSRNVRVLDAKSKCVKKHQRRILPKKTLVTNRGVKHEHLAVHRH